VLKLKFVLSIGFSAGNPQRTQSHKTLSAIAVLRSEVRANILFLFLIIFANAL